MSWGPRFVAGGVRFALWAPDAFAVAVEIDGGDGGAMTAEGDGWFAVVLPVGAGARYRFRIDDGPVVPDPASRRQDGGVHGWSVVVDPAHDWRARDWTGRPWHETVLIELHVGVLGGFAGVAERLPELAAAGITAIELMPVGAFSGNRGWGYDGVLPYAVHEAYGTPES
ncbi:MAG TPA: malto-oligosyltrehalose trehalohydrolase, partial [Sphingomonas sp.]